MYTKKYTVKDEHIDFQGIMDGLYYPFYMESCRHDFISDVLGFDMKAESEDGTNMVLTQFTIKFKKPLVKGDTIEVTCTAHPDIKNKPFVHFEQKIKRDGLTVTEGLFAATCISAEGRPHLPTSIIETIENEPARSR